MYFGKISASWRLQCSEEGAEIAKKTRFWAWRISIIKVPMNTNPSFFFFYSCASRDSNLYSLSFISITALAAAICPVSLPDSYPNHQWLPACQISWECFGFQALIPSLYLHHSPFPLWNSVPLIFMISFSALKIHKKKQKICIGIRDL